MRLSSGSRMRLRKKFGMLVESILQFVCQGARTLSLDKGKLLVEGRSAWV